VIRQGDVLIVPVETIPENAQPMASKDGRFVLAEGESTGHAHSIALSDRIAMFREDGSGGGLFLTVSGDAPAVLEHQEHTALPIAPGKHRVVIQRTFQAGMVRRVAD